MRSSRLSLTLSVGLTLALLSVLFLCLSRPVTAQLNLACTGNVAVDLYSITSFPSNTSPNTPLLNVTNLGASPYSATLTAPFSQTYIDVLIIMPSTLSAATFTVVFNNVPLTTNSVPTVYTANTQTGTLITLAPFNGGGLIATVNNLTLIITAPNGDSTCQFVDTFLITNPGPISVRGDPMFSGLLGQSFQIHGVSGTNYALISDAHAFLNALFSFLQGPRPCPIMPSTGQQSRSCWSHPGSYLAALGIQSSGGDSIVINAGIAQDGFESVLYNGQPLKLGAVVPLHYLSTAIPAGSFVYNNTHEATLTLSHFIIDIENIDGFVNLRSITVSVDSLSALQSHGLLGQTWQSKRYSGSNKAIEGEVDDYVTEHLLSPAFVFNKFESQ